MNKVKLGFKRTADTVVLPTYSTEGSSGMDVRSIQNVSIEAGKFALVSTGLIPIIPEGYELQVRPRSGLAAKKGITVLNTPGTVDEDYRGVIGVILINHGSENFTVNVGDRIAQLVLNKVSKAEIVEVDEIDEIDVTDRGEGGFGSTGVS